MYPLTGNVAAHVGGVQASLLAAQRLLYRLHRAGPRLGNGGFRGALRALPHADHEEEPVPLADDAAGAGHPRRSPAANPTGRSSVLWESLRELPVAGENFGYLLWRKRNCCLL